MKYPFFLIDVDRTLTNYQLQVTDRTWQALAGLIKSGYQYALCTGRHYASIKNYILPKVDPSLKHIIAGGGQIITSQGAVVWEKLIESDLSQEICQQVRQLGGRYIFGQGDQQYVADQEALNHLKNHPWGLEAKLTNELTNWSTPLISIGNISSALNDYLDSLTTVNAIKMQNYRGQDYFDLTAFGVSKGKTVQIWADNQQFDLSQVMAIGDSKNDLEVFKVVGQTVAMGNASDEIKSIADQVINHTDQEGLAQFLESFIDH